MRSRILLKALLLSAIVALPAELQAQDVQVMVYRRGGQLEFDKEIGEYLHEVIIETWSLQKKQIVKTEKIQAYYFVSDDQEIINAKAVRANPDCAKVFEIEEKDGKLYFKGLRKEGSASPAPPPAGGAAGAAVDEPAQGMDDEQKRVREKVKFVALKIAKVKAKPFRSATKRRKIITKDLREYMQGWTREEIQEIIDYLAALEDLDPNQRAYVLRSFGWDRYFNGDTQTAILYYEGARKLMPRWSSINYQLGRAHEDLKQYDDAIKAHARALVLRPKVKYADHLSALLEKRQGTKKLSLDQLEKIRVVTRNIWLAFNQKKEDRAKELVREDFRKVLSECYPEGWGDPADAGEGEGSEDD